MKGNRTAAGQLSFDVVDPGPRRTGPSFLAWLAEQPAHFDRDWPTAVWATRLDATYRAYLDRNGLVAPPLTNAGSSTHKRGPN